MILASPDASRLLKEEAGRQQVGLGVLLILQLLLVISIRLFTEFHLQIAKQTAGGQRASGSRQEVLYLNLLDAWFRKLAPGFA